MHEKNTAATLPVTTGDLAGDDGDLPVATGNLAGDGGDLSVTTDNFAGDSRVTDDRAVVVGGVAATYNARHAGWTPASRRHGRRATGGIVAAIAGDVADGVVANAVRRRRLRLDQTRCPAVWIPASCRNDGAVVVGDGAKCNRRVER